MSSEVEGLLRELAPQVLGTLIRRHGRFDACEDAVQEALLEAALKWPERGLPDNPAGWLMTVAGRRLTDQVRSETARRRREETVAVQAVPEGEVSNRDDTLTLLFLCCHPAVTAPSQIALTLRAVGGLTTAEIADAFLVPESTMAQRISRAKSKIKAAGAKFQLPPEAERDERLATVLHVLYLVFNEGYTASSGPDLHRAELTTEAIRLTRLVGTLVPDDGEIAGLLALMLLTEARRPARMTEQGELIPLAEQDRGKWDHGRIAEGVTLVEHALRHGEIGPYQLQAAIAAVHDETERAEDTDWSEVLALYQVLSRLWPNPMVTLNQAIAVAMVDGPRAGLAFLKPLATDDRLKDHHRLAAVNAHLLEMAGETEAAIAQYREAARRTTSLPEQRYLQSRIARAQSADDR
jgi:RNA polymerase sigma factor (sigma-70 family)